MHTVNVFIGKFLVIDVALAKLIYFANLKWPITLFTNRQAALIALSYLPAYSGQFLTKTIALKTCQFQSFGVFYILQWSPGYSKIPGNVKAHKLA